MWAIQQVLASYWAAAGNGLRNNVVGYYSEVNNPDDIHGSADATATNITYDGSDFVIGTYSTVFNGSTSVFLPPDLNLDGWDFTIRLLFKIPSDDNNKHQLIAIHDTGSFANKLEVYVGNTSESDSLRITMRDGAAWGSALSPAPSTNYKDNTRRHLVMTRTASSGFVEVFIDGTSVSSMTDIENKVTLWPQYNIGAFKYNTTLYNPMDWKVQGAAFIAWEVRGSTKIDADYNSWSPLSYSERTT